MKHEIPFNDGVVVQAAQEFEKLALADGNVFGGRKAVVSNAFATAGNPMFQDLPKCFLHRQGNFITQKDFSRQGPGEPGRRGRRLLPAVG